MEKAKRRTRFGEDAVDLLHIKRLLAVGEIMPDVYARVVIHKGVLVGFFFGAISVSAWGRRWRRSWSAIPRRRLMC